LAVRNFNPRKSIFQDLKGDFMKYFLDSAKLDEIRYAHENWGIEGVTTNPRHIQASGLSVREAVSNIADWLKSVGLEGKDRFPVSVEVDPWIEKAEEMIPAAREIAKLSTNFVVKIPCSEQGISASRKLEQEGIRTNVTLVFSPSQAIAAARNHAMFVSPFVGWKEASGEDCDYVAKICEIYQVQGYDTEIIVAALRNGNHIAQAAAAGADIVTCGFQVYKDSFNHPFTDYGLKVFREAWDKTKK
jgi:transaldolase